jgi:adenine-specific DNA-methyltransferase
LRGFRLSCISVAFSGSSKEHYALNFKESESATKLRGGYYTDPEIASFLLRWVLHIDPVRILEPSCGDGVFIRQLGEFEAFSLESLLGFEIEANEAGKAQAAGKELRGVDVEVIPRDFLDWFLRHAMQPPVFDAVVGNPPFIRYQYLEDDLQDRSQKVFEYSRLPFTRHTNAWVPFVISSVALLRPGGRLAMVVPTELLHVLHAQSLRTYLTQQCSRVLIFDPRELWFENTLQGAVLLLAEKRDHSSEFQGVGVVSTHSRAFLRNDPEEYFRRADYANGVTLEGKWMQTFLTRAEREVLRKAMRCPKVFSFGEIADVAVGIVTGANKFFLVPNDVVEKYDLGSWAYPMFGRSEHVPGVVYDKAVYGMNQEKNLPTNFIWFTDEELESLPLKVQEYIGAGESSGLHRRYKCRIREPWYSVPSVYSTSIGMLKRCHDFPRLIYNKMEAFTTDTAYRIVSRRFSAPSLVFSFVNSLTALSAELEGRHYGGGVLEVVPSEIRRLAIPVKEVEESDVYRLDSDVRASTEPEALLRGQDEIILRGIGLSDSECAVLRMAWMRLRSRRQRVEGKGY